MATEQPSDNVALTFEQLQQVNVAETRLAKVQSEVLTATEIRNDLQIESIQLEKDRTYQAGELEKIDAKISDAETRLASLEKSIIACAEAAEKIQKYASDAQTKSDVLDEKIREKEQDIALRTATLAASEEVYSKKSADLEHSKEKIEKIKELFKTVLQSVNEL